MKKFIKNIFIYLTLFFSSVVLLVLVNTYIVKNQYLGNYQASILDKIERLKSIEEPKIILVGNSNLAFGINSELIEKEIGMPVVNLGLHGGLGNAFHENMAKININSGDIVIVSHTNYSADTVEQYDLLWVTVEHYKNLYSIIEKKEYFSFIKAYPKYALDSGILWITGKGNKYNDNTCYSRKSFNKYGDIVLRPESESKSIDEMFDEGKIKIHEISQKGIDRLNQYNEYVKSKGATLLVAAYPIAYGKYTPDKEQYIKFEEELRSKLSCDVISKFTDYFIPYEYFYNTEYHLTEDGAYIRTKQLIKDIKNWKEKK